MARMITPATWSLLALLAGLVLGSLPVGSVLIRRATGKDPAEFSAHNLGVENVLRFLGPGVALAAFGLDILKGYLAVAVTGGNPWAAVGVFVGHLHPLPGPWRPEVPRGRGNGVLLGVLAGLVAFGGMPYWVGVVPVAVYAVLLAATGYVALATLSGLAAAVLLTPLPGPAGLGVALVAIFLTAAWRHKTSLARILDGTEARLGNPPPVRGSDPNVVLAAFMVHPMTLGDLWQPRSQAWLGWLERSGLLSPALVRRVLPLMRPQLQAEFSGIDLPDGRELRVLIITGPLLPDQIRANPELATRMAIQGARLARDLGAEAFGLGAFWSTVGNKGVEVQEAVPEIAITNGGAYTAATVKAAVPGLLRSFEEAGGSLASASAAVIGANGVVAFGVARMIVSEVAELVLIGRDAQRLERSANTLRRKYPQTRIVTATEIAAAAGSDLVFTATSDPDPVLFAEHVKPGAWIFDLGRPADVDPGVRDVPGVMIIPGGVVRPPGELRTRIDIHFGDGMVPACMAETMIMTANRAWDRTSLGPSTRTADIDYYLREGERLGFEVITRDERAAAGRDHELAAADGAAGTRGGREVGGPEGGGG